MRFCFKISTKPDDNDGASIIINAPAIAGAEQDIVILNGQGKAIATVKPMPGYDRQQVE
jgi:hypothetical protein